MAIQNANFELLNSKILQVSWTCLTQVAVNGASSPFNNIFIELLKLCIPSKTIIVHEDDNPWYDLEIRRDSRERNGLKGRQ